MSPAGDLPSASQRQRPSRQESADTANAWGKVQQPGSVHSSRRTHEPVLQVTCSIGTPNYHQVHETQEVAKWRRQALTSGCAMQFDDLQWDLDNQDGETSWQQPGLTSGQAASQRGDRHSSRRNGTERTVPPRGNRNASSATSEDRGSNRQQQMADSRDRKRFLSHQEIVQVRIQSNQRLLAALDLFEERVAADGQSAASAQRSLQVLVVLRLNQPTQRSAACGQSLTIASCTCALPLGLHEAEEQACDHDITLSGFDAYSQKS